MVPAMDDGTGHYGYISRKDDYLKRLRRIEGQARGLQRMAETWVRMSMQYFSSSTIRCRPRA